MNEVELVHKDDMVEVTKESNHYILNYLQPHTIKIDINDKVAVDDEIIRMLRIRTEDNKKYFVQKTIGTLFNLSRQMINRRWQVFKTEGLISLLNGEYERSKITPQLVERLTELIVINPFFTAFELKAILQTEKFCHDISIGAIYQAQHQLDGRRIIELLREKGDKSNPGLFMSYRYIFDKLTEIIESLIEKISIKSSHPILPEISLYKSLKSYINKSIKSNTNRDIEKIRKNLERDKKRNIGFIKRLLGFSLGLECPDCHSKSAKFHLKRKRFYINERGEKMSDFSRVYKCCNPGCTTKYFTIPPRGVGLYARVHKDVKKKYLDGFFISEGHYPGFLMNY
jgi:hypothetical protein